jgi:hypothetical protein
LVGSNGLFGGSFAPPDKPKAQRDNSAIPPARSAGGTITYKLKEHNTCFSAGMMTFGIITM